MHCHQGASKHLPTQGGSSASPASPHHASRPPTAQPLQCLARQSRPEERQFRLLPQQQRPPLQTEAAAAAAAAAAEEMDDVTECMCVPAIRAKFSGISSTSVMHNVCDVTHHQQVWPRRWVSSGHKLPLRTLPLPTVEPGVHERVSLCQLRITRCLSMTFVGHMQDNWSSIREPSPSMRLAAPPLFTSAAAAAEARASSPSSRAAAFMADACVQG
jgi:hypothetical protein